MPDAIPSILSWIPGVGWGWVYNPQQRCTPFMLQLIHWSFQVSAIFVNIYDRTGVFRVPISLKYSSQLLLYCGLPICPLMFIYNDIISVCLVDYQSYSSCVNEVISWPIGSACQQTYAHYSGTMIVIHLFHKNTWERGGDQQVCWFHADFIYRLFF